MQQWEKDKLINERKYRKIVKQNKSRHEFYEKFLRRDKEVRNG